MPSTRNLAASLFLILSSSLGTADTPTTRNTQTLYRWCKAKTGSVEHGVCLGYIAGVGELMTVNGADVGSSRPQFLTNVEIYLWMTSICNAPTPGAMVQAFVNWAEKHPEKWGGERISSVMTALQETWPCKR
jgi:hypothetical protein